jgi:hypothetical protein
MTRRADPERIYQAKRTGFVARIADKIGQERAEGLIADLEREAASLGLERGSEAFWRDAERLGAWPGYSSASLYS